MSSLMYNWCITIFWILFITYWLICALGAKKSINGQSYLRGIWFRLAVVVAVIIILQLPFFNNFAAYYNSLFTGSAINMLGVVICAAGLVFAVWARRHLGRNWGMPMSVQEKSELVTSGPYALVRHPIYTGFIVAVFGSMLVNGFFWLVILVCLSVYFIYSSRVEDNLMAKQFPDTYPVYKKKTKALIPFIF